MRFAVTARWPSTMSAMSGPRAAALLADAQAIGATSTTGGEALTFQVDTDDPTDAYNQARRTLDTLFEPEYTDTEHMTRRLLTSIAIERTDIPPFGPSVQQWEFPDLVSLAEIAAIAGVSRQRAQQWAKDRPDFPPPALTTSLGPLYDRASATTWVTTARRPAGRPRST